MPDWALPVLVFKGTVIVHYHCYGKIRNCESEQVWTAPFHMNMTTNAADPTASL